ncbi:hypothetical protein Kisp01_42100 [Kineosporia sp. NBRC 101677]|nr:hypothetical protein Kisp01_42100 [Kineosporia sp. NBRC 101677]
MRLTARMTIAFLGVTTLLLSGASSASAQSIDAQESPSTMSSSQFVRADPPGVTSGTPTGFTPAGSDQQAFQSLWNIFCNNGVGVDYLAVFPQNGSTTTIVQPNQCLPIELSPNEPYILRVLRRNSAEYKDYAGYIVKCDRYIALSGTYEQTSVPTPNKC